MDNISVFCCLFVCCYSITIWIIYFQFEYLLTWCVSYVCWNLKVHITLLYFYISLISWTVNFNLNLITITIYYTSIEKCVLSKFVDGINVHVTFCSFSRSTANQNKQNLPDYTLCMYRFNLFQYFLCVFFFLYLIFHF